MPDLATFELRERQRINGNIGCVAAGAAVATILFFVAWFSGWNKVVVLLILAPLLLLLTPVIWLMQRRSLANALARKNPGAVVEWFTRDVNEMLDSDAPPAYAYEALSPEAREQAGDFESFHRVLRASLLEGFEDGLRAALVTENCTRCEAPQTTVPQPEGVVRFVNEQALGVRCTSCKRIYCAACAAVVLKDQDKLFGEKFLCACGAKLVNGYERIIPRERLAKAHLKIGIPKRNWGREREDVRLETTAMYRETGVSIETTSGGVVNNKDQAFVTGKSTISFPMRRVDERWFIDAIPTTAPDPKPIDKRWVEKPDATFG